MENIRIASEEELKAALAHRKTIENIQSVLLTKPGRDFIKYLFDSFDVAELPAPGLTGEFLHDKLGSMRAGNALFKIVCEANFEVAAQLIAQLEKEKYETQIFDMRRDD